MTKLFTIASLFSVAFAAYIPSEPWSTLSPEGSLAGPTTDYAETFAIAVQPIATALAKRDHISQIDDGQIQAPVSTSKPKTTVNLITQIGDGQIQHHTVPPASPVTTAQVVSQIDDGQIQAEFTKPPAPPATTGNVVSQIGDGQIQATVVSQIGDGQIQATAVSQISDGQIQQPTGSPSAPSEIAVSCKAEHQLSMTLKDSVLTDSLGRIGAIVSNRQFQFDGPPPQAGTIYAAGWSITEDFKLALGNSTVFYQCLSGSFYNLYDEATAEQCYPVHLNVVKLVSC